MGARLPEPAPELQRRPRAALPQMDQAVHLRLHPRPARSRRAGDRAGLDRRHAERGRRGADDHQSGQPRARLPHLRPQAAVPDDEQREPLPLPDPAQVGVRRTGRVCAQDRTRRAARLADTGSASEHALDRADRLRSAPPAGALLPSLDRRLPPQLGAARPPGSDEGDLRQRKPPRAQDAQEPRRRPAKPRALAAAAAALRGRPLRRRRALPRRASSSTPTPPTTCQTSTTGETTSGRPRSRSQGSPRTAATGT